MRRGREGEGDDGRSSGGGWEGEGSHMAAAQMY